MGSFQTKKSRTAESAIVSGWDSDIPETALDVFQEGSDDDDGTTEDSSSNISSDDTSSSKDEFEPESPNDGQQNIGCHPSIPDALGYLAMTTFSEVEHQELPPNTAAQVSPQVSDEVRDAEGSCIDTIDSVRKINIVSPTTSTEPEKALTSLLGSARNEVDDNMIEVAQNSDETKGNDSSIRNPNDLTIGSVRKGRAENSKNEMIEGSCSKDDLEPESSRDELQKVGCHPSSPDALGYLAMTTFSEVEHQELPPNTAAQVSPQVSDEVREAEGSCIDTIDSVRKINIVSPTTSTEPEKALTSLLGSARNEVDDNMIEVARNSDETKGNDSSIRNPNDLTIGSVREGRAEISKNEMIEGRWLGGRCKDDLEPESPRDGLQKVGCLSSRLKADDIPAKIACSQADHIKSIVSSRDYWSFDQGQFVECKLIGSIIHEIYSFQLRYSWYTVYARRQGTEYLLTIDEQRFVARVAIHPQDNLSLYNFECFKQKISSRILVIRVLEDEMVDRRNQSVGKFARLLETALASENGGQSAQRLLIFISSIMEKEPLKCLEQLSTNQAVPVELRSGADELLEMERSIATRNFPIICHRNLSRANLKDIIRKFYLLGIDLHQKRLMDFCPSALPLFSNTVKNMSPEIVLFVSRGDVDVFQHLLTTTNEPEMLPFFEYLLEDFFNRVKNINRRSSFADKTPLVNPALGFLFKSFWEIMGEIKRVVGTSDNLLIKGENHWRLIDLIQWPANRGHRPVQHVYRSLECQYKFVFKLMKHFYPNGRWKSRKFQYQFQLQNENQPWWKQLWTKYSQGCNRHLRDVCEERKIWLYIMDHVIEQVVIDRICSSEEFFIYYEPLMVFHSTFVTNSTTESQESFRLTTHSILRYIVETSTFLHDSGGVDQYILTEQMSYLTQMVGDESSFIFFRDLVTEYIKLWELRHELDCQHMKTPGFLAGQLNELVNFILQMVIDTLRKSAPIKTLTVFLTRVDEFLTDFHNMAFSTTWYVKSKNPDHCGLTKVSNKIADEPDCSHLVTDVNAYLISLGDSERPPHYNIHIIRKLLDCVNVALEKTWATDEEPVVGKLDAASTLLGAIRSSLIYMKEQPDYRDFTIYEKDSTVLFVRAVDTCPDLHSFKKRVGRISESIWYLRKKDEIGVERALEMLEPIFGDEIEKNILRTCYHRYAEQFLERLENANGQDSTDDKILQIADDLKCRRTDNSVKEWDGTFKTETVPDILAGLSAIWSLMKSEDVTTGENLLQPHCVQILCALRLFGVDRDYIGAKSHLAQILTGQGKSVVLALVAAVFALTGHSVFIACYSRYLVKRDVSEFNDFFNVLDLNNRVEYITINGLAEKRMNPTVDSRRLNLRNDLRNYVLHRTPLPNLASSSFDVSNTILLIDEVDVFFSKDVYGSQMCTSTTIFIPGLAKVQEHMWATVTSGDCTFDELLEETEEFINREIQSKNSVFTKLDEIRNRAGSFRILEGENGHIIEKTYSSNQELIRKHLNDMARQAIRVSKLENITKNFMVNDDGLMCYKDPIDGIFSSHFKGYNLSFSYLKLKSRDFDCKNGGNYGYLNLDAGCISYAKLPTDFPLIVGVTGTLRNVYDHEKTAMREFYNIVNYTDCPSFYGASIVKFDPQLDFRIVDSVEQWRCVLFERAYSQIEAGRAVMIFLEREVEIDSFAREFGNKFAALNILTENTDDDTKELFIHRAGTTSTLTLVSRGIGRGTDFKSSLAVERNGGIHVVQSFFSTDRKEETQIKGRTARKDNKGSYELILCRKHLMDARLLDENDNTAITYSKLDELRTNLQEQNGTMIAADIRKHFIDHATTIKFYGLEPE